MGTNYYARISACPVCTRCDPDDDLHIGKAVGGWTFQLHVSPEEGVYDLDEWLEIFDDPTVSIWREDGKRLTPPEMLLVITGVDPVNSKRHEVAGRCIGHGPTYDLIVGDFG